jgi:hypothetical protein
MLNTATDRLIRVENLHPDDVRAYDIAWALHHINTFGGHTPLPWDILSRTGLAYMLYVQDVRGHTEVPFSIALLLNNAAKAYAGDVNRSLEYTKLARPFKQLEVAILSAIFERFNVPQGSIGGIAWDKIDRYEKQALAVEFYSLFPNMRTAAHAPQLQYDIPRYPVLVKAKIGDYVTLLKHLSINNGVQDIATLFELPDSLQPYVAAETTADIEQQPQLTVEVRESRSIEGLEI